MSISSLLVPAILFFALGMFACIIKSDLKFPPDMHKMIVIYLADRYWASWRQGPGHVKYG